MSNIPIYRAKEINSNEYVEGYYVEGDMFNDHNHYIVDCYRSQVDNGCAIDSTTLAIHFPDMLDNEGNKIFASLSEDGKGASIVSYRDKQDTFLYFHPIRNAIEFKYLDGSYAETDWGLSMKIERVMV